MCEQAAVVYQCLGVLFEDHDRRSVAAGLGRLTGTARVDSPARSRR
jgi:hypothetical protein